MQKIDEISRENACVKKSNKNSRSLKMTSFHLKNCIDECQEFFADAEEFICWVCKGQLISKGNSGANLFGGYEVTKILF